MRVKNGLGARPETGGPPMRRPPGLTLGLGYGSCVSGRVGSAG
jgi:hypothetical protein